MPALRTSVAAVAAAATAAFAAGCGGDGEDPSGRTISVEAAEGVRVVAGDYFFDPDGIVVDDRAGPLEITLENTGSVAHNLRLFQGAEEIGGTPTFPGGETRSGQVDLEPGTYRFVCTVSDHEALGMVGGLEAR